MEQFAWLLAPPRSSLLFALRFCIAIALALYLSMWLQLDRPYWASLEVAVMIWPIPGFAVARGFARAVGVVVAGCVGLAILSAFAQSYVLSGAALALWIALCSFFASLLRNNLSYGFAIAGFMAGLTVALSKLTPMSPFVIATDRGAEAVLAVVITSAVTVLLSPPSGARTYLNSRVALLRSLAAELGRLAAFSSTVDESDGVRADAPAADEDPRPELHRLASQALALEQTRQYVSYESPAFAHFNRLARRTDYEMVGLVSALSSLHIYVSRLSSGVDLTPLAELAEPARRLQKQEHDPAAIRQAFDRAHERIIAIASRPASHGRTRSLADWVILSRALNLVSRYRASWVKHEMLIAEREAPGTTQPGRSEFSRPLEFKPALRNGIRTLVAVSAGVIVWIHFHDQLPATLLVILLGALTSIFATLPFSPMVAASNFAKGLALAAVSAFFVNFLILPQANDSFAMLMLVIMPFVFIGGLAMATPKLAIAMPGRISMIMFSLLVHVQNGSLPSFTIYIQIVMGIAMAITFTMLAFKLVFPVSSRQELREHLTNVFKELARAPRGSRERFETRMYDRLNRLPIDESPEEESFAVRQAAMAAVNIGLEARGLVVMAQRAGFTEPIIHSIEDTMATLQATFAARRPSLENVDDLQHKVNDLAQHMIEHAVAIDEPAPRRLAIRAAISAELLSSALADYVLAFETDDRKAVLA